MDRLETLSASYKVRKKVINDAYSKWPTVDLTLIVLYSDSNGLVKSAIKDFGDKI